VTRLDPCRRLLDFEESDKHHHRSDVLNDPVTLLFSQEGIDSIRRNFDGENY
jgi:hypothetical protein